MLPAAREVERKAREALDLVAGVALGVDGLAPAVGQRLDATRRAEVQPAGVFANQRDVGAGSDGGPTVVGEAGQGIERIQPLAVQGGLEPAVLTAQHRIGPDGDRRSGRDGCGGAQLQPHRWIVSREDTFAHDVPGARSGHREAIHGGGVEGGQVGQGFDGCGECTAEAGVEAGSDGAPRLHRGGRHTSCLVPGQRGIGHATSVPLPGR